MNTLVSLPRITVVADAHLEETLTRQMARLGAKGYTCWDCRGRGEHEIVEDIFSGASRVRIETIVQPDVAEAILRYLHESQFGHKALCVSVESVQVAAADKF